MPVFSGARIQRGHVLGSILGGFFRRLVLLFVKNNAKNLLTNAVKTGMEVADDVLEGRLLKESAKRRVPACIKRTVRGLKFQSGSGVLCVKTNKKKRDTRRVLVIMAFFHEQSCECTKSELDLFSVCRLRPVWRRAVGSSIIR